MSSEEKFVSFLNNCFVFKKIRNVDTINVEQIMTNESSQEVEDENKKSKKLQESSEKIKKRTKNKSRKLNKKIKLVIKENEDEN